MKNLARATVIALAVITTTALPLPTGRAEALTAVDCAALSTPVYGATKADGTMVLTPNQQEAKNASKYGFIYSGVSFLASRTPESSLIAVHRLSRGSDFYYLSSPRNIQDALAAGYLDQGVSFYAADVPAWCTAPVWGEKTASGHRYFTQAQKDRADIEFYSAAHPVAGSPTSVAAAAPDPNPSDHDFTFAVIPDTQQEVLQRTDGRFKQRTQWLVQHRGELDLRFVVQVGDLVNWDTDDHSQYEIARAGWQPLIDSRIPAFINIGNHDSQATSVGGGARDYRFTAKLARMTEVMNSYFSVADTSISTGSFEPGKIDNTYTRLKAGGKYWMLINLELWPRPEVVKWAADLVKRHKHHNVIISTHSFVNQAGKLSSAANYGSTSPKYLWDKLIRVYPNIKFVLSGHVGTAKNFVMKGAKGNKVFVLLTTYHSMTTNPVRLVRINTTKGTISTWVQGPWTQQRLMSATSYAKVGLVS